MKTQKQKRNRGFILTHQGWMKLHNAKLEWEYQKNYGYKLTLEEISERVGIAPLTFRKVLTRERGVDKHTLVRLFMTFGLDLDSGDYMHPDSNLEKQEDLETPKRIDWGEIIDVSVFYGRTSELNLLEQWLTQDGCRVVALLGMGGIGKTSLAAKLAQRIQMNYEYVIWRSLYNAPPLFNLLGNLIQFFSDEKVLKTDLPETLDERISQLIVYLREYRCLIVLDNAETILLEGACAGFYREGYEDYGLLIKRVGQTIHKSSLLLTSREKPTDVAVLEGKTLPVRSLQLNGLDTEAGQKIFETKGFSGSESELQTVVKHYAGNALALKIVATTIQDIFNGKVSDFLSQDTIVFGEIRELLEQQLLRLSNVEKCMLYWLAINREAVELSELRDDIVPPTQPQKLLEALQSLVRRSLVEKSAATFTLQPVVMEYVTRQLIDRVCEEIVAEKLELCKYYALMKATAKDYVREVQIRLIIQPIINELLTVFINKKGIENKLIQILAKLRKTSLLEQNYTAGNILNLLCHLESDLTGYDFSHLTVWQTDLRCVNLHDANFAHTNLAKCVFAETLGGIHSVAFSPDGKLLATGDTNNEIRLYQVADGKQLLTCKGHTGWIWPITFSPDGHVLASGSDDQTVKLWDISTGHCLATLQGHSGGTWSVAFSPNGHMLASSSEDTTMRLWDVGTGRCIKILQGDGSRVWAVAFSPDGTTLASGNDDHAVKLWDLRDTKCIQTLQGHTHRVQSVAFSPDGHILVSGCHDQTVRLWDVGTGQCLKTLQGHTDLVNSVAFSLDGRKLASGSDDQTVRLWDVGTGQCLKTLKGHGSKVWTVAFSPNGTTLASGSDDQTVKLWDVTTGQYLKTLQGYCNGVWSVTISSQGTMLASGSGDQKVRLWDVRTGQCLKTLQGHSNRVTSVSFNPNSSILASASEDQTVKLWDVSTGKCLKTLQGHSNRTLSVAFSPDGTMLASGSEDQTVKLWNVSTGKCLKTLQGHSHRIWSVAFSPDGHILACGCHDQTIRLWEIGTGQCLQILQGHTDWIWSVAFSPDGTTLVSSSGDQTVKLWNVSTGQCLRTLQGHTNCVYSATFSIDGCTLASGSGDQTVKLWDISTGNCIATLLGHTKLVWSVAFCPDNQTLTSSSEDGTIKLWDAKTGKYLKTLRSARPYEDMNITGITGVTYATIATLKALGAVGYKEE
ncbi:WD40 domain-containing protein [Scytonema sp. NUACC21]